MYHYYSRSPSRLLLTKTENVCLILNHSENFHRGTALNFELFGDSELSHMSMILLCIIFIQWKINCHNLRIKWKLRFRRFSTFKPFHFLFVGLPKWPQLFGINATHNISYVILLGYLLWLDKIKKFKIQWSAAMKGIKQCGLKPCHTCDTRSIVDHCGFIGREWKGIKSQTHTVRQRRENGNSKCANK